MRTAILVVLLFFIQDTGNIPTNNATPDPGNFRRWAGRGRCLLAYVPRNDRLRQPYLRLKKKADITAFETNKFKERKKRKAEREKEAAKVAEVNNLADQEDIKPDVIYKIKKFQCWLTRISGPFQILAPAGGWLAHRGDKRTVGGDKWTIKQEGDKWTHKIVAFVPFLAA